MASVMRVRLAFYIEFDFSNAPSVCPGERCRCSSMFMKHKQVIIIRVMLRSA